MWAEFETYQYQVFFIKDRFELEDIKVEYCPTEQMLADFFTKPLQGNLFRQLRAIIMGHQHVQELKLIATSKIKERVGKDIIGTKDIICDAARKRESEKKKKNGSIPSPANEERSRNISYADAVKNGIPESAAIKQKVNGKREKRVSLSLLTIRK